jgi:hypothetical protein
VIYFTTPDEKHILILSIDNLDHIRKGHPLASQDSKVLICYTHDMTWFRDQLLHVFNTNNRTIEVAKLDQLLREGLKRPVRREE